MNDLPLFGGLDFVDPETEIARLKKARENAGVTLNECQAKGLATLRSGGNAFVTGVAGSGKSFLIREFLREIRAQSDAKEFPVLASTGAAAILVGGRTFHSFFGLGILQGGAEATFQRAIDNSRLVRRLKKTAGVVIDEISMISGETLALAEKIARFARGSQAPWGGIRVIAVGDFAQLPPVTQRAQKDWAFASPVWESSRFQPVALKTVMRSAEPDFLAILNEVREGRVPSAVAQFLDARIESAESEFEGTFLFPLRDATERHNLERLARLPGEDQVFPTHYTGEDKAREDLKKFAPIPEVIRIKLGALVMIRQNDPLGRWVNGSLGWVRKVGEGYLRIELATGNEIDLEPFSFSLLNAEGHEIAAARNYPINLAYASTIHKAQGMTLDRLKVDLRRLWEPGQAYVALSRVRSASGLRLLGWSRDSIRFDPQVAQFYAALANS